MYTGVDGFSFIMHAGRAAGVGEEAKSSEDEE